MKSLGLYIHIPFCFQKCKYCDFLSFSQINDDIEKAYVDALIEEIEKYGNEFTEYKVDTIFFGGGTPSILTVNSIERIIISISKAFHLDNPLEVTIESNPRTLSYDKLSQYKILGINRLSIGLQSFDDRILTFLGRVHSTEDFLTNYNEARKASFQNINVDIMFGIPGQSLESWQDTVQQLIQINPEHISFYGLKIEENTEFGLLQKKGALAEISDDEDREMYAYAVGALGKNGYIQYEISNSSKKGYECHHNLKYWSMDDYLGVGLGAHSFMNGVRFSNETDLNKYIQNKGHDQRIWIYENTLKDHISEYIFTGLRKIKGIQMTDFEQKYGKSILYLFEKELSKLKEQKLINIDNGWLKLTEKGIDISNCVLADFIL